MKLIFTKLLYIILLIATKGKWSWSLLNYSTLSYWLQQKENEVDLYQITLHYPIDCNKRKMKLIFTKLLYIILLIATKGKWSWSLLNYSTLSYWLQQKENDPKLIATKGKWSWSLLNYSTLSYWLQQKENEVDLY